MMPAKHPIARPATTNNLESPKRANSGAASAQVDTDDENSGEIGEDAVSNKTLASPMRSLDEDFFISDQMLHDIMPQYSTDGIDSFMSAQDHTLHFRDTDLDEGLPFTSMAGSTITGEHSTFLDHAPRPVYFSPKPMLTPMTMPTPVLPSGNAITFAPNSGKPPAQPLTMHEDIDIFAAKRSGSSFPGIGNMASSHRRHTNCQCLHSVVILLEELESKSSMIDPTALDSILAYHKEAVNECMTMLHCGRCSARSEYMMLLAVVCEKLIALCEKVVHKYLQHPWQPHPYPTRPRERASTQQDVECVQKAFLGDYEIDQRLEWEYLMKVLIILQLRSLGNLLAQMKKLASSAVRETHLSVILVYQRRLGEMVAKLHRSAYQSRSGSDEDSRSGD